MKSTLLLIGLFNALSLCAESQPSNFVVSDALQADRAALLALKNAIGNYGRARLSIWSSLGHPCRPIPWPHVSCKLVKTPSGFWTSRISGVDLANCSVAGRLPTAFGQLNAVESVNLEGNLFVGTVPRKWGVQKFFPRLKTLNLRNNRLSGALPNSWNLRGGWSKLRTLDLSGNRFVGGLPSSWLGSNLAFRNLQHLDLANNRLGLQPDGVTPYLSTDGWCRAGTMSDGTDGWCPTAATFRPSSSKMPSLISLNLSANRLQGTLPSKWGYLFSKLHYFMVHSNDLYVSTPELAEALPLSWTRTRMPAAFRNLEQLALYPGNDFICALPVPTRRGIDFMELSGDADYAVTDSKGETFDSTGPWPCPSPAAPLPATNPGVDMVTVDTTVPDLVLKWRAPQPTPADTIFGYKVYLWRSDVDQGIIPGWLGKFFRTYHTLLPSGLTVAAGVYTLNTGLLASGDFPGGEYSMAVEVVYIDGQLSDATIAAGTSPVFPEFASQAVGLNLAGTSLSYSWTHTPAALSPGSSLDWAIEKWVLGDTSYASMSSGTITSLALPKSVVQAVALANPADVGVSFRITVTGSAPLILPCTSQWWAIVQRSGSSWSARSSLLGPLLEQPSVASKAYSSGSNTLRLQVRLGADAPTGAVLYYKVWQRVLLGRNLILNGSSVTLQGVDTAVVATSIGGLLTVTFDVELFVSADGFETSDTAEFTYVYGDIT